MGGWQSPYALLQEEFVQRAGEGCRIPGELRQRFAELDPVCDRWNDLRVDPIYDDLMALAHDPVMAGQEPNELDEIRALRPDGPRDLRWRPSEEELTDRLWGAWTGRCAGCALGKPVECLTMPPGVTHRAGIKDYLAKRGDWPLRNYFSGRDLGDGYKIHCPRSQRENIAFMEGDDDTNYSLVGLFVLEEHGARFDWRDVADCWMKHIPMWYICTSETQAMMNWLNHSCRDERGCVTPAFTRRHRNPYREWIGAQIRADGWAWACAGKPELAAEFAHRDASWTHERNGIYGEMFFAAIIAATFVEHDPARLVKIGLSEIPRDCRLAKAVKQCLGWIRESADFEACMTRLEAAFPKMSGAHTINNALVCVLSLFYGRMDTVAAPAVSVMCGLDTDCNGATVGSIVGAACGRKRFNMALAGRLNDIISPDMMLFRQTTLKDLAARTAKVWHQVEAYEEHP